MLKYVLGILFFLPLLSVSQQDNGSVRWVQDLNWEQVKQKARNENKYILVDCFATWCVPCKKMDQEVFSLDSVADYINNKYIALKVQMDVTSKDNQYVQNWHSKSKQFSKDYRIDGYPAYLFFSSQGTLVDKQMGYVAPGVFMDWARAALAPGKLYVNPFHIHDSLMERYAKGERDYSKMFDMYELAAYQNDTLNALLLKSDLDNYLASLPSDSLFTVKNLKYMASVTIKPTSKWFSVFYKQDRRVNKVMGDNNYAQKVVDNVILKKVVYPYLGMHVPGMMLVSYGKMAVDTTEADWFGLEKRIKGEFGAYYARRNTQSARFVWYKERRNLLAFARCYFDYLDRYGFDSHLWTDSRMVNGLSYEVVFLGISDNNILEKAIKWMRLVVEKQPWPSHIDTYACIMYKAGRREDAISWEEKALEKAVEYNNRKQIAIFTEMLQKMTANEKLPWYE